MPGWKEKKCSIHLEISIATGLLRANVFPPRPESKSLGAPFLKRYLLDDINRRPKCHMATSFTPLEPPPPPPHPPGLKRGIFCFTSRCPASELQDCKLDLLLDGMLICMMNYYARVQAEMYTRFMFDRMMNWMQNCMIECMPECMLNCMLNCMLDYTADSLLNCMPMPNVWQVSNILTEQMYYQVSVLL